MKSHVAVWLALVVAIFAVPLYAQPRQPTLRVQTATGQTTFHIGETIPLKLTFASPNDTQYSIYDCCFGRDAPAGFESFEVSPSTGWADPLATYYAYAGYPPMTAEIGSVPFLASKPVESTVALNEWVRFDQPGVYTVRIKSSRAGDAVYSGHQLPPLQSNPIELNIIPATPGWQSATLDRGDEDDLLYLATPAAIDKMTAQLSEERYGSECRKGLLGLPDSMHGVAVASMKKRLNQPDYPITAMFFDTMVVLELNTISDLEGFLKQELQTSPGPEVERFRNQERTVRANLLQAVLDAARNKEPAARAETVQMLLLTQQNIDAPAVKSQAGALLIDTFPKMDAIGQVAALQRHWDMLRSPRILPELRAVATLPARNDDISDSSSWMNLKSVALWRWYELDPEGAKKEIFAQIGSSNPAFPASAIDFLPAESLPQFEGIWAEAFVTTNDPWKEQRLGSLLVRFGTGAASSQIASKLGGALSLQSCVQPTYALAYLVRFSPEQARPLLKQSIGLSCNQSPLNWISEQATGSVLNDIAVEALDDPRPAFVSDAVEYLTFYGRESDREPLWNHYVKWTQLWAGKGEMLDRDGCKASCAGAELGIALISNPGWFADDALISRVVGMCIGETMCKQLKDAARMSQAPYRVNLPNASTPLRIEVTGPIYVGQYRLKSYDAFVAKIAQYPAGSKFMLFPASPRTEDQRRLEGKVEELLKKDGMSVEKPSWWPAN